jgi:hypothetical protein
MMDYPEQQIVTLQSTQMPDGTNIYVNEATKKVELDGNGNLYNPNNVREVEYANTDTGTGIKNN